MQGVDEFDKFLKEWNGTEKALHSSLNAEIRLRKLTLTKVKSNCPLFKQPKLSIDEKVRNIKSRIDTQLSFKTLDNMEDLESAITSAASNDDERSTSRQYQFISRNHRKCNR